MKENVNTEPLLDFPSLQFLFPLKRPFLHFTIKEVTPVSRKSHLFVADWTSDSILGNETSSHTQSCLAFPPLLSLFPILSSSACRLSSTPKPKWDWTTTPVNSKTKLKKLKLKVETHSEYSDWVKITILLTETCELTPFSPKKSIYCF